MTAGFDEQAAGGSVLDGVAMRTVLAASAVAGGLAAGWLAAGSVAVLVVMAVPLAAGNGYGKAYSP
jgi:hypothetical protein